MKIKINNNNLNDVFLQTFTYLENHKRVQTIIEDIEEFKFEDFGRSDPQNSTGYYTFKKSDKLTITDIIYKLHKKNPVRYGFLTNNGPITFGANLILSIANDGFDKPFYTNINQIDDKMLTEIALMADDISIFLLNMEDIIGMRQDWINAMEEEINRYRLRYLIISDLSLIYRPNIDVKLIELAKESHVNIIAFTSD